MFQVPPVSPQQQVAQYRALARQAHERALRSGKVGMGIGGVVFALVGLGSLGGVVFALLSEEADAGALLGSVVFALAFLGGAGIFFAVAASLSRNDYLRARGVPTQVRIIEVLPGGRSLRIKSPSAHTVLTQSVLRLEVLLPGGGSAVVVHKEFAPHGALGSMQPGAVMQAFVDPRNPAKLLLEWPS